jgi:hypothetical protein
VACREHATRSAPCRQGVCTLVGVQIYFNARDWKQLQEYVVLLSKRRSQLKQAVQSMVRQAMGYIEQTPDQDTKVELIKTLQTLTEGKVRRRHRAAGCKAAAQGQFGSASWAAG